MTLDIEEIRERRAKIDGAPWSYYRPAQNIMGMSVGGCNKAMSEYRVADIRGWGHLQYMGDERGDAKAQAMQDANGEFIAHAPADVDFLLAEIDRLNNDLASMSFAHTLAEEKIASLPSPPSSAVFPDNL